MFRCYCSGLWAIKKKNGGKFPTHAKKAAAPAVASKKPAKFYAAGRSVCMAAGWGRGEAHNNNQLGAVAAAAAFAVSLPPC